jgi:hypothetical protein
MTLDYRLDIAGALSGVTVLATDEESPLSPMSLATLVDLAEFVAAVAAALAQRDAAAAGNGAVLEAAASRGGAAPVLSAAAAELLVAMATGALQAAFEAERGRRIEGGEPAKPDRAE